MRLKNSHAEVSVQPLGAMLHDCVFRLDGRAVRPLYDAPWRGDSGPDHDALPRIIQGLGSEWPCVPFGRPGLDMALPADWVSGEAANWSDWAHGFCSNNDWRLERRGDDALRAVVDYPDSTPILRLEREVRLLADRPGLALSLTVHARREARFPLGLHPVLSMEGAAPGTLRLEMRETARVWSFPVDVEPGRNRYLPDLRDCPLDRVPTTDGGRVDVRSMPPEGQTEDLLMLTATGGRVGLENPVQGCVTTVSWDEGQLPACALWVSNGGRDYYPWNGRVAALGIEPVASAFDLGIAHSLSDATPLARQGIATHVTVHADRPFTVGYGITVDRL